MSMAQNKAISRTSQNVIVFSYTDTVYPDCNQIPLIRNTNDLEIRTASLTSE